MKIKGILLPIILFATFSTSVSALDFSVKNVTIEQAIIQINKEFGYSIFVNASDVNVNKLVSISVTNASIDEILSQLFSGQNVSFLIDSKKITVMKKPEATPEIKPDANKAISGKVVGSDGVPVVGAVVLTSGNEGTAVTDIDGKFSLSISRSKSLDISCLGYQSKSVEIGGKTTIDVVLSIDMEQLDEVVVVGYGTQKKVDLTGSIATVNLSEITESRPVTNLSNALSGMAAGVCVTSAANKPGSDDATILVRGQGTLNSSAPLVIVDGVESSFSSVNPQDVESMTVLKDAASAAIYGSRAANGVILITTKSGNAGQLKVNYHGYVSFESAKKYLNMVSNYADYMEYANEAEMNSNLSPYFSQASINLWRSDNGANPLLYPNTDWFDETFKTGIATNHIVSVNGGTEKARYYVSMGFLMNPGVMDNSGEKKYSFRANVDFNVTKWLGLGMKLDGNLKKLDSGTECMSEVFSYMYAMPPCCIAMSPDGRFGFVQNPEDNPQKSSPLASLYSRNGTNDRHTIRGDIFLKLTPVKGLTLTANYRYSFSDGQQKYKPAFFNKYDFRTETIGILGGGRDYVTNYFSRQVRNNMEVIARYENKFFADRFGFHIMAGMSQESFSDETSSITRYDLVDPALSVLDACTGDSTSSGGKTEWAMRSYFARLNLNWCDRYLFEANLRADGSSRFRPEHRWGFFPSFSAGWRISEEKWMDGTPVDNLKLRASWGGLGNNSVGNYDALAVYSKSNYSWGDQIAVGVIQDKLPNEAMTWETTYVTDIGLDFGFFKNRLNGTIDGFIKTTKGILITLPAPAVHGAATIPTTNAATVSNKGVEVSLSWNDQIGDFSYGVSGNFTYVHNNVDKFKGDDYSLSGANMIKEGLPINAQYGYVVDRIIQTSSDMNVVNRMLMNNPDAFKTLGKPSYGDFLYKDINGDGLINDKDRTILSDGPTPKYLFGLNLTCGWRGIDFSMLLQGQAGAKVVCYQDVDGLTPVYRWGYAINKDVAEGAWREGRKDATWPRLTDYTYTLNTQLSDFYLENKSFVKIRNIQLGYTLPERWTEKAHMERIRIYGSLENFFTFTKYRLLDPEVNKVDYPTIRQAVIGLNITFF